MTYALCSDLHAHAWSQFATTTAAGHNSRLEHVLLELGRLAKRASEAGCLRVYVAGDIFHVRGSVKPSVLNPLYQRMSLLTDQYGVVWRLMPGNHDLEGAETDWLGSAIVTLAENDCIEVVSRPTVYEDDKIVLVPWCKTKAGLAEKINEALTLLDDDPNEYDLILHTGINGVLIGVPDHGWMPEELASFGFKRVFSGHYHAHKVFTLPRPSGLTEVTEVVSIGSLTHQTWSDVGTKAGWLIVGEEDFEFHENAQPKFIDFDGDRDLIDYAGNYVRVQGIELEEDEIRELRQGLTDIGAAGVVVHAVPKAKVVSRSGAAAKSAVTVEHSIATWIKEAEIDEADAVERSALDVLARARSIAA